MPTIARTPSYRLHKPSGRAVVTLDGRDHYLGRHKSKTSREQYDALIAAWLANGRQLPGTNSQADLTVAELMARFWKQYVQPHYRKPDGTPTSEPDNFRLALRPLKQICGDLSARDFGPLALKSVRQAMIDAGGSRDYINKHVRRIKLMFKWGVENELVAPSVHHGLQAVSGLKIGRSDARETEPVRPVPDEHVDAVRPHVSSQVWAMVELQRLTGMRSGEVVIMRGCDLETTGVIWLYRPESHKTQHHGHDRVVELGPHARQVVRPFLQADTGAYLFSATAATVERNAERRQQRKTKVQPSQRDRIKRCPKRAPSDRYTRDSYRRAIDRACKAADVPKWHPHQLRHSYATRVRKDYGIEAARILLGHRSIVVTEVYAEIDRSKARDIVAQIG